MVGDNSGRWVQNSSAVKEKVVRPFKVGSEVFATPEWSKNISHPCSTFILHYSANIGTPPIARSVNCRRHGDLGTKEDLLAIHLRSHVSGARCCFAWLTSPRLDYASLGDSWSATALSQTSCRSIAWSNWSSWFSSRRCFSIKAWSSRGATLTKGQTKDLKLRRAFV